MADDGEAPPDPAAAIVPFVLYDSTGRIFQTMMLPKADRDLFMPSPGMSTLDVPDAYQQYHETHYVRDGVLAERQEIRPNIDKTQVQANGADAVTILGLPMPCQIEVRGPLNVEPTTIEDGSLTLTFDTAGAYVVRVTAEPAFIPWGVRINAV